MLHKYFKDGQKLDVAGLNQITVLIDRSETELTEVGLNEWRPKLDGPPHKHNDKDQVFFVVSGKGIVKLGGNAYEAKPGCFAYVPAGTVHQSITTCEEPLSYLLFNTFTSLNKEGHLTFAEHIEKVKLIRKKQSESRNVFVDEEPELMNTKMSKFIYDINSGKCYEFGSNSTLLLLDRNESNGCECMVVKWPAGNKGAVVAHLETEQTLFVLNGRGQITVGSQTEEVQVGDIVFVPRNTPHATEASANQELVYLCYNSIVEKGMYESFDQMYNTVASQRIRRWKSKSSQIGE